MNPSRSRLAALITSAFVVVAGCGGGQQAEDEPAVETGVPASTATQPTALPTETAAPPPLEGGGLEEPRPPQQGDPAISVATLPIGGFADRSPDHPGNQCVHVNWITSSEQAQIPDGVWVEITGVVADPDVVEVAVAGCPGEAPPCTDFRFVPSGLVCEVAMSPDPAHASTSVGLQPTVSLTGSIRCEDPARAPCADFVAAVRAEKETSIPLEPLEPPDAATGASTDLSTGAPTGSAPDVDPTGGGATAEQPTDSSTDGGED